MFTHFKTLTLVAGSDRARQVMQGFRSTRNEDTSNQAWLGLMIAAASLLAFVLIAIFVQRRWKLQKTATPRGLFSELCLTHRLNWMQRRLLWRLAQSQKLAEPASLFLTPECFEIGRMTVEMRPLMKSLSELRERLFAEGGEETKTGPAGAKSNSRKEENCTAALPLPQIPPTLDLPQWNANAEVGVLE